MVDRRLLIGCALLSIAFADAAQNLPRVGWLGMDAAMQATRFEAFRKELRELGYIEGKNIVIEARWADGHLERMNALASELVAAHVNVIVTAAPPGVSAAQGATRKIPIVVIVNDPVKKGIVASFARPGGNITGIAFQDTDLSAKRLDLFRQVVPGLSRVVILWNEAGTDAAGVQTVEDAAKAIGLQVLRLEVREPRDFATAMAAAKSWGAQGVIQMSSPFITKNRQALIDLLTTYKLPATCEFRLYVVDGCLMTYSADLDAMFRREAHYVDRILKGAKPAELAIEQPREFEFVINLKTAQALGLTVPPLLLLQANEVIR